MKKYLKLLLAGLFIFMPFYLKAEEVEDVSEEEVVEETLNLETISFNNSSMEFTVGDSTKLDYYYSPNNFTEKLIWTSSNENVVKVDDEGNLTAVGYGNATIKVEGEKSALYSLLEVSVYNKLDDIKINGLKDTFSVEMYYLLEAVLPEGTKYSNVEWYADNQDVYISSDWCATKMYEANVKVGENQICVRFNKQGTYTLTAKVIGSDFEKKITVNTKEMINSIYIDVPYTFYNYDDNDWDVRAVMYLNENKTMQLSIEGYPERVPQKFTYKSSDESIATVNETGLVTGLKSGLVTIIVTSEDKNASSEIKIKIYEVSPAIASAPTFYLGSYDCKNTYMVWEPVKGATSYKIYRATSKKSKYKLIATSTNLWYEDLKLTCGTTYYYKIEAVNSLGSKVSGVKSIKLKPDKTYIYYTNNITDTKVKLNWYQVEGTGYEIYRSTKAKSGYKKIKTITKIKTESFTDSKLKANTTYYYKIRVYKTIKGKKIYSDYSDVMSIKTAPTAPKVSIMTNEYNSLKLNIKGVKGATKYEIYRGTNKNSINTLVGSINKAGTFTDEGLDLNKTYYYKVRACNNSDCGSYSKVISKKVVLKTPSIIVKSLGNSEVSVNVSSVNGSDGYEVYKSTNSKKGFKLLNSVTNEELILKDTNKKGKTYYYKVRTYKLVDGKKVYSSYSKVSKVKVK